MIDSPFSAEQQQWMTTELNSQLISTRKGSAGMTLRYLEGHDAIDQANHLFGHGNWGTRLIHCAEKIICDPVTNDPIGLCYEVELELRVQGCLPIVEVGSAAVTPWTIGDYILSRRMQEAKNGKSIDLNAPTLPHERLAAHMRITEAHETARKGAVTDAMKRALRLFGPQFGNSLYGVQAANNGHHR